MKRMPTVALRAWMVWLRGKPIEVRMAMLSSGGELSRGVAPMGLSLEDGPRSIMEGRVRGSAKSDRREKDGGGGEGEREIILYYSPFTFKTISWSIFCFIISTISRI